MDYNQFSFWDFNRKINPKHVKEMKESIIKNGYRPELKVFVAPLDNKVLPNKHIILDGQHRVKACMELNVDFSFEIIPAAKTKAQIEELILLYNIDRDNLTLEDYLYINRDLPHYKTLIELRSRTNFPVSILLNLYQSNSLKGKGKQIEPFANGNYTIDKYGVSKILNVKKVFDVFQNVKKPNFKGSPNSYILPIGSILSNSKIDADILCKKIESNFEMLEYRDRNSNVLILYAIYNKKNPNKVDIPANLNRVS